MDGEWDYLFKILMIGDSGVGKSALLVRYTEDTFSESFVSTIGVDFKIKTLDIDGKRVKLQIWDTAGQERFRNIITSYYRGAHGVFLIYSVTDENSFRDVAGWLGEVEKNTSESISRILVGSKSDLEKERKVPTSRGEEYAKRLGVPFIETSAKTSHNVDDAFMKMAKEIMARLSGPQLTSLGLEPRDKSGGGGEVPFKPTAPPPGKQVSQCC